MGLFFAFSSAVIGAGPTLTLDELPSDKVKKVSASESYTLQVRVDDKQENKNILIVHQKCGEQKQSKILRNICNVNMNTVKLKKSKTSQALSIQTYPFVDMAKYKKQLNEMMEKPGIPRPEMHCLKESKILSVEFPRCKAR